MMKNQRQHCFGRLGRVSLFTLVFLLFLAAGFDFYYDLNDDTTIKDIISGAYTGVPEGYSIQMLYPLGLFLALLYKAIPGIAWYGLFLCLCQFGVFFLIGYRLTGLSKNRLIQYGLLSLETLLFAGLLFRSLVMVQYSITSGICMVGAVFLYITGKKEVRGQLITVFLVILSFMIRTELCLMMMPVLLVAGFFNLFLEPEDNLNTRKQIVKNNFIILGIALSGMLVMKGADTLYVNQSQEWKNFMTFFEARTKLYDFYGIPDYAENQAFFESVGLSAESYTLLQNYNFSMDTTIDTQLLESIVDYMEENPQRCGLVQSFGGLFTKNSVKDAVWLYQNRLKTGQDGCFGLCILLCYVFLPVLVSRKEKRVRMLTYLQLFCLFMARTVIWIYLLMVDRMLDRILIPLYLGELVALISWICRAVQEIDVQRKEKKVCTLILAGFVVCLTVTGLYGFWKNGKATREEFMAREQINSRWEALISYCKEHPEQYFLVDVYSSTSFQGIAYSEKMFEEADSSYRNFDLCGGWVAKSPLWGKKLKESGLTDVQEALRTQEKTYFVAACDQDLDWMNAYYLMKGYQVSVEVKDTVKNMEHELFYVYEIK